MTIATDLLQRHIQTLVDDSAEWQTLIADDISWELAYAPSIGHPARLSGRAEAVSHATWFLGAVENFRFFDLKLYALVDPQGAIAERSGGGASGLGQLVPDQDHSGPICPVLASNRMSITLCGKSGMRQSRTIVPHH